LKQINGDDDLLFIPGETPLIIACRFGCVEIVSLLLKAPHIDINLADDNGNTPLFHAALKGHEEIVIKLVKTKGIHNNHKQSAMDFALIANNLQIAAIIECDSYSVMFQFMSQTMIR
jgi:ankyrin repeat protein